MFACRNWETRGDLYTNLSVDTLRAMLEASRLSTEVVDVKFEACHS